MVSVYNIPVPIGDDMLRREVLLQAGTSASMRQIEKLNC